MDHPELKLVGRPEEAATPSGRLGAVLVAAVLATSGLAATIVGVDPARHPLEPRETAQRALELSLDRGSDDSAVRGMLLDLRSGLGRRPLDSRARVVYAALLLNLGRRLSDARAAAHHAALAADLAPVTVPVVRLAVLTLTRTGDEAEALSRIRDMFGYDPSSAAALLGEIEPLLSPESLQQGLPNTPNAWFAWATELRRAGRLDEAFDWNTRAHRRWPDHLPNLRFVVGRAVSDGDWDAVERWLPVDRDLGESAEAAPLLAYRARLKAARGDEFGARDDLRRALAVGDGSNLIRILAGEGYEDLGDHAEARRQWNRALFEMRGSDQSNRRNVVTRLARLEDRHGRPSAALRLWETVLELDPDHVEARRRIRALGPPDR